MNDPATHEALEAIAHGRSPQRGTGSAFVLPALKSIGHVHDVLISAGKGAYADVARAAPPMALMGFVSHVLTGKRAPRTSSTTKA